MKTAEVPRTLSITRLSEMYRRKETTPENVVREILNRIDEDTEMNVWITPPSMERIKPYLDRLASLDPDKSPLWGIPFAIKDNIDLAGTPTTAACPEYAYTPTVHAAVVERLIAAGAIPLGKTNMDQFATGLVGTRSPYGETHNALRNELISGGSSSGSAVAVARGHAAFALGTDTAGSGRVPASLNRLVGFKPSLGAWPLHGVVPACASLDCVCVFTSDLEDALIVDGIARGIHESDPWSRNVPSPMLKLPAKILVPKGPLSFFGPYANEYENAWNTAVERLNKLNIPIEYVECDMFSEAASILYDGPWVAERWSDLGRFVDAHPGGSLTVIEQVLRTAQSPAYDAASVFQAMHKIQVLKLETKKLLDHAMLVMPTSGGTWTRNQVRLDPIGTNRDMGRYTNHCNLLDLCAVAVPADDAAMDIPFGITFFALSENEDFICGAASSFLQNSTGIADAALTKATKPFRENTFIAVCGLHMRGYPLEKQMHEYGAHFVREAETAPCYQLIKLPTIPAKPGLIKKQIGGAAIRLEVWEMPLDAFGSFAASIPAPLGISKVELQDGTEIPGFVCEAYAVADAEDITLAGGWRNLT